MRGQPDQPIKDPMGSNQDAVEIGVFGDPLQFRQSPDVFRVGSDHIDGLLFDQILEILPQVDLFAGVNRKRSGLGEIPKNFGVGVRRIVAGDDVFDPRDVERFERPCKRNRVFDHPAGAAVQGKADFLPEDFLHGFDPRDDLFEAALGQQTAVRVRRPRPRLVVPAVGYGAHHRRIVKTNRLLDEGEALLGLFHLGHVLGVVLRCLAGHRKADASVVGADAVADLTAQQLIHGHSGRLPRNVPEGDLDRAHGRAPGLEGAHPADLQHHPVHVRRVFAEKIVPIEKDHRLEIRLGGLGLAVTGDALIGG